MPSRLPIPAATTSYRDTGMATLLQIEANRLNSQRSTGPRSAEGKATSSMNALKSGIDAQSQIIRGENIADLEALTAEYMERFQPATPEQRQYVDTLVRDDWQLRRLAKADAQIWEYQMQSVGRMNEAAPLGQAFCRGDSAFTRLQRRIDATERSYQRSLRELERLQSECTPPGARGTRSCGSESSPDELTPAAPGCAARGVSGDPEPTPQPAEQPSNTVPAPDEIGFVPQAPVEQPSDVLQCAPLLSFPPG